MSDHFHGDEFVLTPGEIVDAGEEFILIDALAGVVHDKYVSNVDLLIAFKRLAGDGGAERQVDGQALDRGVDDLVDTGLLVVIAAVEMESVSHEEVVDVGLEVSIGRVDVDEDLLAYVVDYIDTLDGVAIGIFLCFLSNLEEIIAMNDFHSVNDCTEQAVVSAVKQTVLPVNRAHLEHIFLTDDDFLHLAAVVNGAVLKRDSHLQGSVDADFSLLAFFSGLRRLGGISGLSLFREGIKMAEPAGDGHDDAIAVKRDIHGGLRAVGVGCRGGTEALHNGENVCTAGQRAVDSLCLCNDLVIAAVIIGGSPNQSTGRLLDPSDRRVGDITGGDLYLGLAESYQICFLARQIHTLKQTYPDLHYHITSGDTEQVAEKLDKGLLDFAVLAEIPDAGKYESLIFPEADIWGLVFPKSDPLAKKKAIHVDDLIGLPLFCSGQGWEKDIPLWAKDKMDKLHLEGSFRLAYNASVFAREHLGYLLTFDRLVDTSPESGLIFRPLSPVLETKLYLVWKKYQAFSPIAERFLKQIQASLAVNK